MPKTLPAGVVRLQGTTFRANVMPDVFDSRDLEYRPRLAPLPAVLDRRQVGAPVLEQQGNSCTGHALAALINTVLSEGADRVAVSPYMLYRLARRYDEFPGETDEGSSLRGALKGWYYHGVLPVDDWPALEDYPDLDGDQDLAERAFRRPLGAFYRVNAHRLDDMQSAVNELGAIVVSGSIHTGWIEPTRVVKGGREAYVIERPPGAGQLGGHAFAITGYDDIGFLVQNSWGTDWAAGGFATLPYDDWLASAYDAWVARPGVPAVVRTRERAQDIEATSGVVSQAPGPDLARLSRHVVNLGNGGVLCTTGRFTSTPAQLDRIIGRMGDYHRHWGPSEPKRVVLYAHGGLVSERSGLGTAQAQLNWWLNNRVYPISFAWQSGPVETLVDHLTDLIRDKLPFGGIGFDLVEQADRFVEKFARANLRWMWREMKENATAASAPMRPSDDPGSDAPGASLLARKLGRYRSSLGEDLQVHLVGHSAGSIFTAGLLSRLADEGVPVASVSWLAPAIRVDEFQRLVLPHLASGHVGTFVSFALRDHQELNDVVGAGPLSVYQKSLLVLVAHALEDGGDGGSSERRGDEVPIFGMERFITGPGAVSSLTEGLPGHPVDLVFSPSQAPSTSCSGATSHGGFDNDVATMTSVLLRILGQAEADDRIRFEPHTALLDSGPGPGSAPVAGPVAARVVDAEAAGSAPVTLLGAPQPSGVNVPASTGPLPEAQLAPETGSSVMDALAHHGWSAASVASDVRTRSR